MPCGFRISLGFFFLRHFRHGGVATWPCIVTQVHIEMAQIPTNIRRQLLHSHFDPPPPPPLALQPNLSMWGPCSRLGSSPCSVPAVARFVGAAPPQQLQAGLAYQLITAPHVVPAALPSRACTSPFKSCPLDGE